LAGLWPWGAGRVSLPKGEQVLYMPRTPYLPPGTLREVLAYPSTTATFDAAAYDNALGRLKLERLVPLLDASERWDRELSEDEQQALAFARLVLHAPPWVLIDEVLDSLEDEARSRIIDVFAKDLRRTGVIHIGRPEVRDHFFSRVLHLVMDPAGRRLKAISPQPAVGA
jgi:putative ATP-binding cassette transporter